MTPNERYLIDPKYFNLVHGLFISLVMNPFTKQELHEAVVLAHTMALRFRVSKEKKDENQQQTPVP